jgi:predicted DCC family thiol-disulfide oxidoreductase YuxK
MPSDVSTAVLFTDEHAYIESDSILRMLYPYLKFPYFILGFIALFLIPRLLRDFGYRLFARNRGEIWKFVKKITRMGDTAMRPYRDSVLGIDKDTALPESWGFERNSI